MLKRLSYVGLLTFGPLLFARPAAADTLAACGNIDVEANASCEVDTTGGCTARCTPLDFEAQCDANGALSCQGSCAASASASCNATCDVQSCVAECTATPATFDCSANCSADASAMCDGECESGSDHTSCVSQCQASVKARCDVSCQGHPGTVDCTDSCQASCQGQCTAQANASCDVTCQDTFHVSCTSQLTGGCQAKCEAPQGALFCNGQYVDYGNNLQNCVDALESDLAIQVNATGDATASSGCTQGEGCEAQAEAHGSVSCAVAPGFSGSAEGGWILSALGLVAFGARRRRR